MGTSRAIKSWALPELSKLLKTSFLVLSLPISDSGSKQQRADRCGTCGQVCSYAWIGYWYEYQLKKGGAFIFMYLFVHLFIHEYFLFNVAKSKSASGTWSCSSTDKTTYNNFQATRYDTNKNFRLQFYPISGSTQPLSLHLLNRNSVKMKPQVIWYAIRLGLT